jgi:hypothetical protein
MVRVLLVQLPIPRHTFGLKTGNIPLGAACLKLAARGIPGVEVDVLPESLASYLGDAALLELLRRRRSDVVGFTVFSWNLERSLHVAGRLKEGGGPRIVFGGPEITPDNRLARSPAVDCRVFGEGEAIFRRLLSGPAAWKGRGVRARAGADTFRTAESPYLCGLLEPELENIMLLETQRGCPYRCGFCFYNKSRPRLLFAEEQHVLRAVAWAVERRIGQVYLLDPSLNVRPGLKRLLTEIARLNASRAVRFFSEIRAEAVDDDLADRFAAAGFDWFEIGLQTTNPRALGLMRRPTRLPQVLAGAQRLKARGITPSIDLILGLPGDDLAGFMRSVDWVAENDLQDDVQVFPLAVLPGTDFRRRRRELGLHAAPRPPYTVLRTGGFSPEDFQQAYDYAESRFDTVFFPLPDLDASWRVGDRARPWMEPGLRVRVGAAAYTAKLIVARGQTIGAVRRAAGRLTQPYQVLVAPGFREQDHRLLQEVLCLTTTANPFSPLEVVFFEPEALPRRAALLAAVRLRRPHFLDGDLRYLFPRSGDRAVLLTVVSADPASRFQGEMERQVYWWRRSELPRPTQLARFRHLDGILIDTPAPADAVADWQDRAAAKTAERYHIGFGDALLHRRWVLRTRPDEYAGAALQWV